jgi:hypothetical protein
MTVTDDELYAGFTPEQAERCRREAREAWGEETVAASEQRIRKMSRAEWQAVGAEGEAINRGLAPLVAASTPDAPEVQALVARHHAWIERFFHAPAHVYSGLAGGYTENPDFRTFYEKYAPGMADFLAAAMRIYAQALPEE